MASTAIRCLRGDSLTLMAGYFRIVAVRPLALGVIIAKNGTVTQSALSGRTPQISPTPQIRRTPRIHRAWIVAAATLIAAVGAAGSRATPGVLIDPLHTAFGWSRGTISTAVSVNLILYGLTAPFAAALMERFGLRRVVGAALTLIALGSGLTIFMTAPWELILCWGVLVGLGAGAMALAFVATVTSRWFVARRGLVTGILTAGGATGQLIFLPLLAWIVTAHGWKAAVLVVTGSALIVTPLVVWMLRDYPADVHSLPYGGTADQAATRPVRGPGDVGPARRTLQALTTASRTGTFWFLVSSFAICGATTNGLVGTQFIPAAHDHGLPETTAASLLALVGVFDVVGTIFSGWLTDRIDSRVLLGFYYLFRGLSLMILPDLFASSAQPKMLMFIIFYGLDWVATVPPTIALCRQHFGANASVVFGWVFAAHQVGASIAATASGVLRDQLGTYTAAWYGAGCL
jgi:MFS family permease